MANSGRCKCSPRLSVRFSPFGQLTPMTASRRLEVLQDLVGLPAASTDAHTRRRFGHIEAREERAASGPEPSPRSSAVYIRMYTMRSRINVLVGGSSAGIATFSSSASRVVPEIGNRARYPCERRLEGIRRRAHDAGAEKFNALPISVATPRAVTSSSPAART